MKDFVNDIMPYAETHYRVLRDRQHRAIAGLSMGGAQTLEIAIPHPDEFAYVGVFSSGIIGIVPLGFPSSIARGQSAAGSSSIWRNSTIPRRKRIWKLFWFSTGKDDLSVDHDQGDGGAVQETRLPADVPGKRRRAHLDQLARVSERVRSAACFNRRVMAQLRQATLIQSWFMFQGLEHTAIASPDPKRLAEWYVQKLDFRINYTYGGNYFVRASNGTLMEIIPSEGIARRKR